MTERAGPAAERRKAAPSDRGSPGGADARRFAKLPVSEIRLYNQARVAEGVRAGICTGG